MKDDNALAALALLDEALDGNGYPDRGLACAVRDALLATLPREAKVIRTKAAMFDEIVETLENLLEYSQTGCVKGIPREDELVLDSVAAVLARAETVEMP